ncbi:MAG TPA: ABC transporter substrate-binding protein [Solirubrobacterales bacterium]|nr:ABC transporter substrate-binding protein [Solirubrobacterales bacterium]
MTTSDTSTRSHKGLAAVLGALVALILAVVLSACGGSSEATGSEAAATVGGGAEAFVDSGTKPVQGGTIRYAHEQETPCLTGGWVQEAYLERQFADSLVSQTKTGKIVPWLATKWTTSPDHLVWTFDIKPGVKFTDGTPLDAQAVADNFNAWLNPDTLNPTVAAYIGAYFKSAVATGPDTFQLTLSKPYAPLLSAISQGYFGILSPKTIAAGADAICNTPVGSGPFILDKWTHGQNVTFVRNPNYDSAPANALHQGPAYVDKIVWSFVSDPTTRWGSLTTGQSDLIYDVPATEWASAPSQYEVQQYITPGRPMQISLNTDQGVFSDVNVRKAFAYAADREGAVASAFEGKTPFNGNGALSPSTPDYDKSLNDTFAYDPDKAAQLLDQAGWKQTNSNGYRVKDGKELDVKFVYITGALVTPEGVTALENLQAQWKEAGFNVELKPVTLTQYFSGQYSTPDSYDATIGYWTSPSPGVLYIVWRPWDDPKEPNGNNSAFYNDQKLVDLIAKGNSSFDPKVQQQSYYAAQKIVTEEQAATIGVWVQETTLAINKDLHDVWLEASQGEPVFSDAYFSK